jgi:hypothetical protein
MQESLDGYRGARYARRREDDMRTHLLVALVLVAVAPGMLGAASSRCDRRAAKAARQLFSRMRRASG